MLDDNAVPTTIFGNGGNDTFQVGQLYASARDGSNPGNGLDPSDYFATTQTTDGFLSDGVSYATTLYGGDGDDTFIVDHNLATLWLYGQDGNDTFTVQAFVKVNPNDPDAPFTNINGGGGADFISYTVDAPVKIDGGDGLDTIVVVGTDFGDTFVITDRGIFGAGLYVSFTNVEKVDRRRRRRQRHVLRAVDERVRRSRARRRPGQRHLRHRRERHERADHRRLEQPQRAQRARREPRRRGRPRRRQRLRRIRLTRPRGSRRTSLTPTRRMS